MRFKREGKSIYITLNSERELEDLLKICKLIKKKFISDYYVVGNHKGASLGLRLLEKQQNKGVCYVAGNVIAKRGE